ncbi:hypothetical protein, partial [Dokdonella sp.]|uniref:hypothetical protein n=1 Tax=Dokdonella sp. TaxID=2291710 RepID=UPI003C5031B2
MTRILVSILGLFLIAAAPVAHAEVSVDVNKDIDSVLAGDVPLLHLPDAEFRIAVFEFEDPDKTGLGSSISTLIAREVLLRSGLRSLGILNYYGSLEPTRKYPQSYFDKVDLVLRAQKASLAIWGIVRRDGKSIVIDVQAQLPDSLVDESFAWSLKLPRAMGGETLHAKVSPTRMQIQHVRLPQEFGTTLVAMARSSNVTRESPSASASVAARVSRYSALSVAETRGSWSKLVVDGKAGWVQRPTECTRECEKLLGTASFVGALLKFPEGAPAPAVSRELSPDTVIVSRQLSVLGDLREKKFRPAETYLTRWDGGKAEGYGAPYADFLALGALAAELHKQRDKPYDEIRLDEAFVRK